MTKIMHGAWFIYRATGLTIDPVVASFFFVGDPKEELANVRAKMEEKYPSAEGWIYEKLVTQEVSRETRRTLRNVLIGVG
jgi:hypothetical protein